MNLKLITLLLIISIIASVGIVCATENIDGGAAYGSSDNITGNGVSQQDNMTNTTGDIYDPGVPYHADGTNATGHVPASGEAPTNNTTSHVPASGEAPTNNTTENVTNATTTVHNLPATGNPIIALLAVSALIGVYTIKRK